jgi:type II secretory pathway pseudopilin PulG
MEMVVSLAIMSVVMALFTASFLQQSAMFRRTTAVSDSQTQLGKAFRRLDSELRYAADVRVQMWPPSQPAASLLYVLTTGNTPCYALSIVGGRLQLQGWARNATPGPGDVLAVDVAPVSGVDPFAVTGGPAASAGDGSAVQTATPKVVTLAVLVGGSAASSRRELRVTFLAPNTFQGPRGVSLDDCTA